MGVAEPRKGGNSTKPIIMPVARAESGRARAGAAGAGAAKGGGGGGSRGGPGDDLAPVPNLRLTTIVIRPSVAAAIDQTMERASKALVETDYHQAEQLCLRALSKARKASDFERIARICLPLQEARRQMRHLATDAGLRVRVKKLPKKGSVIEPGCYLLEPPLIGWDGHTLRALARDQRVPVLVLVKEPTTSKGLWPIVGVGEGEFERVVARVLLAAPPTGEVEVPDARWFLAAQEALGDAAIVKASREPLAAHRVEDLIELLDAVPDHEKLSQRLADTAREAMVQPPPSLPRRRPAMDEPFGL